MNPVKKSAEYIGPYMEEIFSQEIKAIPGSFRFARAMLENIKDFSIRGGKRLRPALVYYGYKLMGGGRPQDIFKASLAVELFHNFLLMHDDIIDQDELRRGKATVHKVYENECKEFYQKQGSPEHFGESMAILAGDLCCSLAFKTLLASNFPAGLKIQALEKMQDTLANVIFGEELDVRFGISDSVRSAEILDMYRLKTGIYTFESPLQIGAILANASEQDLELISQYAIPCGIAFQIQDDILGMFGDEERIGKPVGSDLRQGKQTLLIIRALEKGTEKQREKLRAVLGNKNVSAKDVEESRLVIKNTGALVYCENLAQEYIGQAKKALKQFDSNRYHQPIVKELNNIADFIIKRIN